VVRRPIETAVILHVGNGTGLTLCDPGEIATGLFPTCGSDIGLRHVMIGSGSPNHPAIRFTPGRLFRGLTGSAFAAACLVARPARRSG